MRNFLIFLQTAVVIFAGGLFSSTFAQSGPANISGVVFPNETDANGNPLSVYIEVLGKDESEKNKEYFIVNDARGKELIRLLYNNVNAIGIVSTNPSGALLLTVQKYSLIESKPEDLEDEY